MRIPLWRGVVFALLTSLLSAGGDAQAQDNAPIVAVASDLQFALPEIAAAFEAETGHKVRLSMGSTGNFARQIREGAPFEIFMAADEQFIFDLARDGFTKDEGTLYAIGRIVLMVPPGARLTEDLSLTGLRRALDNGHIRRFAIANPTHAPYGMRAQQALEQAGLWEDIQPFLVMGENVSQAAQFALSGTADGGIIALSLALAPQVATRGTYAVLPEHTHEPLFQRMALLTGAGPVAEAFYAYLQSPPAREIFVRYGFALPEG